MVDRGDPQGCWLWQGATNGKPGYGKLHLADGKQELAHRYAYALWVGPIPDGLEVLHRCDVKLCCNPHHLFLGSQKDNVHDCRLKGRHEHKLKADDVLEMRRLRHEEGVPFTVLAERYGVTPGACRHAVTGLTWGHI
jgi:hypothetical protein